MSKNQGSINNSHKNKKTKLETSPITSKKTIPDTPKKPNNPDLFCNNCGVYIDNIKYFHSVFTDEYGDIDVCDKCIKELENVNEIYRRKITRPSRKS